MGSSVKYLNFVFVVGCLMSIPLGTYSQIPEPEAYRKEERLKTLAILERGAPQIDWQFEGLEAANESSRKFLEFYRDHVLPLLRRMDKISFQSTSYRIALDRALYENDAEKASWEAKYLEGEREMNGIRNGDDLKNAIKEWAALSTNLQGPLADEARIMARRIEINAFASDKLGLVNRLSELMLLVDDRANTSEFAKNLESSSQKITEAKEAFEAGKMTLAEAAGVVAAQRALGEQGQSRDIAEKAKDALDEAARIRTALAQSKGFRTWAEYEMATQSEPYDPRFNTVAGRIKFLEEALQETEGALQTLLGQLAKRDPRVSRAALTESHLAILQPDVDSFGKFYPRENVDAIWSQALRDSGFPEATLNHINRDVYPRPSKYTHAYMNAANVRTPKWIRLDSNDLSITLPSLKESADWIPAEIYIVQNFYSDSIDALRVAFHEGGHSLHYTDEVNPTGHPTAYGYVEVHSITQEYFALDPEFLRATATTRDGQKPTEGQIHDYLLNAKVNELLQFRTIAARALYELMLWDYDYSDESESFVERSVRLYGDVMPRATGVSGAENHGVDYTGRGPFNAPHFRSGEVQYIGYVLAAVGAYQSYQKLLDLAEKESGRRSLFKQAKLAEQLIGGYYRNGWSLPFPKSVEQFTGREFSVIDYAAFLNAAVTELHIAAAAKAVCPSSMMVVTQSFATSGPGARVESTHDIF